MRRKFKEPLFGAAADVADTARAPLGLRLPQFVGGPEDAHDRLRGERWAIIGLGSVGGAVAENLARLQPAEIFGVDPSNFKLESIHTHRVGPDEIGQAKATYVLNLCRQISPATKVIAHVGPVQDLPASRFANFDAVLLASDNLRCEAHVAEICMRLAKPLVQASVDGPSLTAQVRFISNASAAGPCLCCNYGATDWRMHDEELVFSCAGGEPTAELRVQPTMSVAPLCSIAADLACVQILRHTLGLGAPVADTLLTWNGYSHQSWISPLARQKVCRLPHVAWRVLRASRELADCTVGELAELAGASALEIESHQYHEAARCCGRAQPIGRFVPVGASAAAAGGAACSDCGRPLRATRFHIRREVPVELLPAAASLRSLGIEHATGVLAGGDAPALVLPPIQHEAIQ